MTNAPRICLVVCAALVALVLGEQRSVAADQTPALKIVVLEGEGAVNIIQQKTAVAPVIEVRDRNDQPVSGAIVRFAIQKGRATFNGARTLTVSTDALGRATAAGLAPTGTGPLSIAASATFQGQTAAIAISQTSVATAAQAAGASAAGTGGAAGGGLSHTAIAAIVGGAGAAGLGAAVISRRNAVTSTTFTGPLSGQIVITRMIATANGVIPCVSTRLITGSMTIELHERGDGSVTGFGSTTGNQQETSITQSLSCTPNLALPFDHNGSVSGGGGSVVFSNQQTVGGTPTTPIGTGTISFAFNGAVSNGVITGTVSYSQTWSGTDRNGPVSGGGSTTFPVTLR